MEYLLRRSGQVNNSSIGFIGAGKLGTGLAMALHARGYLVVSVASRSFSSAQQLAVRIPWCHPVEETEELARECDLVLVTTPDEAIGPVVSSIQWRPGQMVVHCSGALSLEVLDYAVTQGAFAGSFHPLQTLACLETPEEAMSRLAGITYAIDGHDQVVDFLRDAAERLGGQAIHLRPEHRALYHAAATLACGYVIALLKAAADLWQGMGYSPQEARAALAPLAGATVANFGRVGPERGVTGPIVRGDVATVARHLEAVEKCMPRLVPLVCTLGLESLPLMPQDAERESGQRLRTLLTEHLRDSLDERPHEG